MCHPVGIFIYFLPFVLILLQSFRFHCVLLKTKSLHNFRVPCQFWEADVGSHIKLKNVFALPYRERVDEIFFFFCVKGVHKIL